MKLLTLILVLALITSCNKLATIGTKIGRVQSVTAHPGYCEYFEVELLSGVGLMVQPKEEIFSVLDPDTVDKLGVAFRQGLPVKIVYSTYFAKTPCRPGAPVITEVQFQTFSQGE